MIGRGYIIRSALLQDAVQLKKISIVLSTLPYRWMSKTRFYLTCTEITENTPSSNNDELNFCRNSCVA